ncbi:MAG: TrmB family transcriptional regulator [Candidatus Bathyarchaeia archaeon]
MSEEKIKKILKDFGLTETETEVYLFLASHDPSKGTEIARQVKKDKAQVYHILKSLQAKGLVESTLEAPVRFTPVPFEKVVESTIKAKRDEAARIESIKQELFDYWKNVKKGRPESPLEKFIIIEGSDKIYQRIFEMINNTQRQLSIVSTVQGLLQADRYGLLDAAFEHPLKSQVQFRFLTELSEQNVNAMKTLLGRKPQAGVNFKGRNPDLGLRLPPRMVIRDEEEILLFITPRAEASPTPQDEVCLWTNCKTLVQSFSAAFKDSWSKATDVKRSIQIIENRKLRAKMHILSDATATTKQYDEAMLQARQEVFMMTSDEGLGDLAQRTVLLKEWSERRVSVKIMAPITSANLKAAQSLAKCYEVKHVPTSYLSSTIIDGRYLFQFKNPPTSLGKTEAIPLFENIFYTNNLAQVEKTKDMLMTIWENAQVPSPTTLATIFASTKPLIDSNAEDIFLGYVRKVNGPILITDEQQYEKLTEEDVLRKIINAQKTPRQIQSTNVTKQYGFCAQAIIHPPKPINPPDILIYALHYEKQSTYGALDAIFIHLWLETPKGYAYVPVAFAHDNPKTSSFYKRVFGDISVQLLEKDEIQVQLHGKNFFCGWTKPIFIKPNLQLEPSSILLEGFGDLRTGTLTVVQPSGVKITQEFNGFEAFVTFFHPSAKYSGPGTDGVIYRDAITTISWS